ncbi:MAG: UDP-N-acetylmuramoyl-L-alanine--D-glutamate ligase [Syntrophobacteraceae bacterium]|jgi:UDP-N-acetylmuramoylalanine--D-glutamate ligase|nr:UDP-N-acetylmuramoyl-L-alanine--D-glutamate ligase [Syntrophobacteraceae bacterium]
MAVREGREVAVSSQPKRVLVVGMGVSGRAVCAVHLKRGARVVGTDLAARERFGTALEGLESMGCVLRLGMHLMDDFLEADQIVVSPGVPLDLEPLRAASEAGVEIVGELEWAWRQTTTPVVAVTGTNGKTTTTSLLGEMLKNAGQRVFVGGNIGTPLSQWILEGGEADVLVLEVSSFQLDTASTFRPRVGALLNITEDHLDRYDSFEAYIDSKFSMFQRQTPEEIAIINLDDPVCRQRSAGIPGRLLTYSRSLPDATAGIQGGVIRCAIPGMDPFELKVSDIPLRGVHNEENIMAAVLAASLMGAAPGGLRETVRRYRGLPHRVEWVRCWKGIDFYDDSKGTNVGAVVKALENFDRPVWLFLGGRDKLGSYEPLIEPLQRRGRGVLAFGESAPRIREQLERFVPTRSFPDLEEAFREAVRQAEPGDVVLLSPACSSFDQYESYAQRGDHFKRLVAELSEPAATD